MYYSVGICETYIFISLKKMETSAKHIIFLTRLFKQAVLASSLSDYKNRYFYLKMVHVQKNISHISKFRLEQNRLRVIYLSVHVRNLAFNTIKQTECF